MPPTKHARLSASDASRWTRCTAAVPYCEKHGIEKESSEAADEGTQAHEYAEKVLNLEMSLSDVPDDFRPHVKLYTDECLSHGGNSQIEVEVPLYYSSNENGTCDFVTIREDGTIVMRDLKYGAGKYVSAEKNLQLSIYMRSLVESKIEGCNDDAILDIGIVQPRHHAGEPVRNWLTTWGELKAFTAETIDPAVEAIRSGDVEFKPSEEACMFCPAKNDPNHPCAAWLKHQLEDFADEIDPSSEKFCNDEAMSPKDVGRLYYNVFANEKKLTTLIKNAKEWLQANAELGQPYEGTKLVQGRDGNTVYSNESKAERMLSRILGKKRVVKKSIVSPTQAREMLVAEGVSSTVLNHFDALTHRPPGKLKVALESDKREAVSSDVEALNSD